MNKSIFGRPDMTEEEFFASLSPDLSDKERRDQYINYYYNTDYSELSVLAQMPDAEDRMRALVETLQNALTENMDYNYFDVGMEFTSVLPSGNIELVMVMLCGYGIHSLAKLAMIVRDEEYRFHCNDVEACMVVHWSNGKTTLSDCHVDVATLGVYNYSESVMQNQWDDGASIDRVELEVQPVDYGETHYFRCYSRDEVTPKYKNYSYWYTPDPSKTPADYAN